MSFSAYQNLWEEFVPRGYIIAFPRTEEGLINDHQEFGWDLQFLVTKMQEEGIDNDSPIFGAVDNNTALMGHSMGGGAAFLAADSLTQNQNIQLKTIIYPLGTNSSHKFWYALNDIKKPCPKIIIGNCSNAT